MENKLMEQVLEINGLENDLHYEILLGRFIDLQIQKNKLEHAEKIFVNNNYEELYCHGCLKPIKKGASFIAFHDVHDILRYAQMLTWKETRGSKKW
jgi:hypothetical protein